MIEIWSSAAGSDGGDTTGPMSVEPSRRARLAGALELVIVGAVVLGLSLFALWRMDYLSAGSGHQIRMTDSTRTAYVARNLALGRGYSTDELPAFLLEFYDHAGKLHADRWVNADRFPFTAYAIAALYKVTGSTSYEVGILGYNLIWFVGFLVLLYWLVRTVWGDRWSALFALALALLHPLTYVYLYLKDADMMFLTTAVLIGLWRYFERGDRCSRWCLLGLGSALGLLYLARPNIGAAFIVYVGVITLRRGWTRWRADGLRAAVRSLLVREGVVVLAIVLWCLPFVIHSMREWGQPFFSANAIYQRPLGTRYAMNTDTWWKYSDPSFPITLRTLIDGAPGELTAKFTSSWLTTLKTGIGTWGMELALTAGLLAWLAGRVAAPADQVGDAERVHAARVRRLAGAVGAAVLMNLALLPLYGSHHYGYRHYLSFFLPLVWLCAGRAVVVFGQALAPAWDAARTRLRERPGAVLAVLAVAVVVWNIDRPAQDANQLFVTTSRFMARHWLMVPVALALVIWHRVWLRGRAFPRAAIGLTVLVVARFVPNLELKRLNLAWFPADTRVWDVLRERHGLVLSFAMQGEVNWVSGRRNIPAPENVLHTYSLLIDHGLQVEDLYVESADAMLDPYDGVFHYAAPGFESYQRMQRYQGRLPGYQVVFHAASTKGYPRYGIKPRAKASTVWRLVDPAGVQAMLRSPEHIAVGDVGDVVYTTHGWGDYVTIDGRPALAATSVTRERYLRIRDRPVEDTALSFFLDDRRPTSVDLEVYATHPTHLAFYWNLDLYAYDRPGDRPAHAIGGYDVVTPGWQHIRLAVPPGVTRRGLNKLGFRADSFQSVVACPPAFSSSACERVALVSAAGALVAPTSEAVSTIRVGGLDAPVAMRASLFAAMVTFGYGP